MENAPTYGRTRPKRLDVTYAQIERAATEVLRTGTRPTVALVTQALGGGSPRTILEGLNRYWRDLGNQVAGHPDTLKRLPAAVADLAEGLWQRALSAATDAAQATTTETEGQVSRLKNQLEVRAHTLSQREIELDELIRARERTVKELEENLRAALSMLTKREVTIASLESRLSTALQETEGYRKRLAALIQRAVVRRQRVISNPAPNLTRQARPSARTKTKRSRTNRANYR